MNRRTVFAALLLLGMLLALTVGSMVARAEDPVVIDEDPLVTFYTHIGPLPGLGWPANITVYNSGGTPLFGGTTVVGLYLKWMLNGNYQWSVEKWGVSSPLMPFCVAPPQQLGDNFHHYGLSTIDLFVKDSNGCPLPGFTVHLYTPNGVEVPGVGTCVTDEDGEVGFVVVGANNYYYIVEQGCFKSAPVYINVPPGCDLELCYTVNYPPVTAKITAPANGALVSGPVAITGTGSGLGTLQFALAIDGQQVATSLPFGWDTKQYADGEHTICLTVTDCLGRKATDTIKVIVDNTPPMKPLLTGLKWPGGAGTLDLAGLAEDGSRIDIWILLPGAKDFTFLGGATADECGRWSWAGPLNAGHYVIRLGAHDLARNWSDWSQTYDLELGAGPLTMTSLQQGANGYQGASDTFLDVWNPTKVNGTMGELLLRANVARNGLLRFDLAGVPAGTVQRAALALYIDGRSNQIPLNLSVYELLKPWAALEATWNQALIGQAWATAGAEGVAADYDGNVIGSTQILFKQGWVVVDVTTLVNKWLQPGANNNGMLLRPTADGAVEYVARSSDWWQQCRRPLLVLTLAQ